jgi:hypothetical protein
MGAGIIERLGHGDLLGVLELSRSSPDASAGTRRGKSGIGALADQFPFKLP